MKYFVETLLKDQIIPKTNAIFLIKAHVTHNIFAHNIEIKIYFAVKIFFLQNMTF